MVFQQPCRLTTGAFSFEIASFLVSKGIRAARMISMKRAHVRLYEELNDYLPDGKRKQSFALRFEGEMTAAELLQAVGIPESEIDLILCNGTSVGVTHRLRDEDRVSIFPVFEALDLYEIGKVRAEPLRRPAFVAGPGLRRLAAYMRMLGFDTRFDEGSNLEEAAAKAKVEKRILITRDPPPAHVSRAILVRDRRPRHQVKDIMARLNLQRRMAPLSRCPRCNSGLLQCEVPLSCRSCGLTWNLGAHSRRVRRLIRHLSSF
jgi:uncharacterized protein with PIN domain/sulfur carrier protein ThiS